MKRHGRKPRWGLRMGHSSPQGSRCAATLGCVTLAPSGRLGHESSRPRHRREARRGAVLIAALVCVAVAAVVFMSALKMASAQRHRMETELWELQAAWLAESGLERAAERLAAKPDFAGETWNIPAEQLGGSYAAVVRIRVESVRDQPKSRLVRVEADYPDHPQDRARESREAILRVP